MWNNFWLRLRLCWLVLCHVPDSGLLELKQFSQDVVEFYHLRDTELPATPPITWKTKVSKGKTYIRPVFPVVEDEEE